MSTVPCRGGDESMEAAAACRNETTAFRLKMVAIATILTAAGTGVTIPLIGTKRKSLGMDSAFFVFLKAFAAGVVLATGFVHILPDGQSALGDPCLPKSPWSDFPFPGFLAMLSALATLAVDFLVTRFYEKRHGMEEENEEKEEVSAAVRCATPSSSAIVADEDGAGIIVEEPGAVICQEDDNRKHATSLRHRHPHSHKRCGDGHRSSQIRNAVVAQILEIGIASHSVIIGLSVGVSNASCTIRPLIVALSFHQFFEGFALGGCISQARFHALTNTLMACFFAVTTPVGIAAGTAAASLYDANSPRALVIEGLFDCVSVGILIYMALVDLIAPDFFGRSKIASTGLQQISSCLALFLGAGSMSFLAWWT